MFSTIQDIWHGAAQTPSQALHWFNTLSREEWTVTLMVVCALGFLCLLGFQTKRI